MPRTGGGRSKRRLRGRAETALRKRKPTVRRRSAVDLQNVVHELEIHQVELEMQNEELRTAQVALGAARDRYADLYDRAPVGYLRLDAVGTIRDANRQTCALLSVPRERPVRRMLATFVSREDRPVLAGHLAAAFGGERAPSCELRLAPVRGQTRVVRLDSVLEPRAPDGRPSCRTAMIDITRQALAEQQLRVNQAALERSQAAFRELSRRLMTVEEAERRRIAADLHDDIGQRLHALQVDVELLARPVAGEPATRASDAATIRRRLEDLASDLEGLARQLHPKIVEDLGLAVALSAHAEDVGRAAQIQVRFRARRVPSLISPGVALCLYRIGQEALRNVVRHARTGTLTVTLAGRLEAVGLCVADEGPGFDPGRVRQAGRLGLLTMDERVQAYGGRFRVRSRPGSGTHVHAWVPLTGPA